MSLIKLFNFPKFSLLLTRNLVKPLGRWGAQSEKNKKFNIDYGNIDNCGTCMKIKEIYKKPKDEKEINKI